MKKFAAAALMLLASAAYADRPAKDIYTRACTVCHVAGVANAPKTHDVAAWKTRMDAKGMDGLVQSVTNGLNAMPPRGMCMDCTPSEYKAVIEFMMSPAS